MNLALNNLQWLICHKTKPNQTRHCLGKKNFFKSCKFISTYLSLTTYKKMDQGPNG